MRFVWGPIPPSKTVDAEAEGWNVLKEPDSLHCTINLIGEFKKWYTVFMEESQLEVNNSATAMTTDNARCPVCSTPIGTEEQVCCDRCHTPHHRDCWQYAGGCSIFGCRKSPGRQIVSSQPPQPSVSLATRFFLKIAGFVYNSHLEFFAGIGVSIVLIVLWTNYVFLAGLFFATLRALQLAGIEAGAFLGFSLIVPPLLLFFTLAGYVFCLPFALLVRLYFGYVDRICIVEKAGDAKAIADRMEVHSRVDQMTALERFSRKASVPPLLLMPVFSLGTLFGGVHEASLLFFICAMSVVFLRWIFMPVFLKAVTERAVLVTTFQNRLCETLKK